MNTDFIYYIMIDGEVKTDLCFSTEEEAVQYITDNGGRNLGWHIMKWSVD